MLTPKERLKRIMEGKEADRPACICPGGMMNMVTEELMEEVKVYLPEPTQMQGRWRSLQKQSSKGVF